MSSTSAARRRLFLVGLAGHAGVLLLWWLQQPEPAPAAWRAAATTPALPSPDGRRQARGLTYEAAAPRASAPGTRAARMLALTFTEEQGRRSETWVISDVESGTPSLVWLDANRLALQGAGRPRVIFTFARGAAP